jgi:hypothetical protein
LVGCIVMSFPKFNTADFKPGYNPTTLSSHNFSKSWKEGEAKELHGFGHIPNSYQRQRLADEQAGKIPAPREITKKPGVSPNTIKAVLNKAGLGESTSMSSRAFELYVQQKTPLEAAIELNL